MFICFFASALQNSRSKAEELWGQQCVKRYILVTSYALVSLGVICRLQYVICKSGFKCLENVFFSNKKGLHSKTALHLSIASDSCRLHEQTCPSGLHASVTTMCQQRDCETGDKDEPLCTVDGWVSLPLIFTCSRPHNVSWFQEERVKPDNETESKCQRPHHPRLMTCLLLKRN